MVAVDLRLDGCPNLGGFILFFLSYLGYYGKQYVQYCGMLLSGLSFLDIAGTCLCNTGMKLIVPVAIAQLHESF